MSESSRKADNILGGKSPARSKREEARNVVQAVAAGDTRALETLYDAYLPLVFAIAARMSGPDEETIESIVHATFLAAWHGASSYRSGNVGAWLGRITRNIALEALGNGDPRRYEPRDPNRSAFEEERYLGKLDGTAIRAALAGLPPAERMVLELGFFQKIGLIGMAEGAGIAPSAVKRHIRSGLTNFRAALSEKRRA